MAREAVRLLWFAIAVVSITAAVGWAQSGIRLDDPAIEYLTRPLKDPVAGLNRKIQAGTVELRFDGGQGYLRSVLEALDVPVESQMAVFSKTSVQAMRIDPKHPRTLFFNDSVIVGWVPRGTLEVAAMDPQQGMVFYTVDQRQWVYQQRRANPAAASEALFRRRTDCLNCHVSKATHGIPGTLVRSVFPALDGTPLRQLGMTDTDLRTPFEKLWGGWYVTGNSGSARHMGNVMVSASGRPESMAANQSVNLASLTQKVDTGAYLSPYSDIVALMVFEHQAHLMNLLIESGWRSRTGAKESVEELVDYLLFVDEPLLRGKIQGTSGFAEKFAARGPWDGRGRSLRQFDLERRLMRYPCSYMVYSKAFDALPPEVKEAIYQRMWQILSGEEKSGRYVRLSLEDRKAVVEILRDTKSDLPDYFRGL